jgi:hypothetical protein
MSFYDCGGYCGAGSPLLAVILIVIAIAYFFSIYSLLMYHETRYGPIFR